MGPTAGGPLRHPAAAAAGAGGLFPPAAAPTSTPSATVGLEALGLVGEEVMAQWRASLMAGAGAGAGAGGLPALPTAPLTPPASVQGGLHGSVGAGGGCAGVTAAAVAGAASSSPGSPRPTSADPASKSHPPSLPSPSPNAHEDNNNRPSSGSGNNLQNGSKPPSDAAGSPDRLTDSKSPASKTDGSPLQSPHTAAAAAAAAAASSAPPPPPTLPNPVSLGLPMPLPLPPLVSASRIPKSDPMEGKLQDMLRYNMENYAGQALDTLATSRRVRELLSVHNIGQRLFAKYVLGLSQGTVSELLSKPKCWEKLTEKGRDSYRKMHAWAYDERAVMLLKSLIPRKGELMRTFSSAPLLLKGKKERSRATM